MGYNWPYYFSPGLKCYNSSVFNCLNNTLCSPYYGCGTQCRTNYNSACANDNQTICDGFDYYNFNVYVCGTQKQCYDNTISVCVNNNTVCPIGNQLCSGVCYNPQTQYCTGGNNTIYCLNNPSSSSCLLTSSQTPAGRTSSTSARSTSRTTTKLTTTTPRTSATTSKITTTRSTMRTAATSPSITTPKAPSETAALNSTCCAVKECTADADCCQRNIECQCYRHNQTDIYGSCLNPYVTPICANGCPVQAKCKYDTDCCKCQCAQVTFTNSDGLLVTKKQCAER
ncbi:unnamed protein product [Didymodactylos carnosus]|uniref:Uncharacterized protein n=1 Tax=Didymodactylos carnosus TaxID=1234261 RepID=A0A814Y7N3_9BILA|nr:unnamed protein product [Didymodactylos carnosus]CAF3989500.1 unnamed protein product [Didymodactylos carnosus]